MRSQGSTSRQKPSIEEPGNKPLRELQEELERASDGLVYSSESDRPFEFFAIRYRGKRTGPLPGQFARLVGAESDVPVELRSLESFFARHTTISDPYDREAQRIRPRYEDLVRLLSQRLHDVKVYRIGRIEIACYIVGLDSSGNMVGLKTTAVET